MKTLFAVVLAVVALALAIPASASYSIDSKDIPGVGTVSIIYGDSRGFDNNAGSAIGDYSNGEAVDNNFYVYTIITGGSGTVNFSFTVTLNDGAVIESGSLATPITLDSNGRYWYAVGPVDMTGNSRYAASGKYTFRLYANGVVVGVANITK